MKELEIMFVGKGETRGFEFRQVLKSPAGYIYEIKTPFESYHYEVFQRKENSRYDCISYPQSQSFGTWAWSYVKYEDALNKFNQL